MSGEIHVVGPKDPRPLPQGTINMNVTSQSRSDRGKTLSPFHLGPVPLYWGLRARKMENAWQFSKVYRDQVMSKVTADTRGNTTGSICVPTPEWWKWALKGWNDTYAHRFPMGKGAKPLFSLWKGEKLDYIAARKRIYAPLYAYCAQKTGAWSWLLKQYESGEDIYLWDFDGYNYKALGMNIEEVLNNPKKIMGHGHVLAMMLEAPHLIRTLESA